MMNQQELLDLKNEIEEDKAKASELKGQKKQLLATLQKDWGCSSTEEADKKVAKMTKEIEKLNDQIVTETTHLEETYL